MNLKQLVIKNDDIIGSVKNSIISLTISYNKTYELLHKQLWHKDQLKASGTGYTISVSSYDDSTSTIDPSLIPQRVNFLDYSFTYNSRPVKVINFWNIKSPSQVKYYKDDLMALGLNQLFANQNPNAQYSGDPSDGIYHDTCLIRPKAVNDEALTTHDMTGWYIVSSIYDSETGNTTVYYEDTINEYEYSIYANQLVDNVVKEKVYQYTTIENNYNTLSQLTSRVVYTLLGTNINVRTITYDPELGTVLSDTNYDTDTSSYTIPEDGTTESTYLDENSQEQTYTQQTISTTSTYVGTNIVSYLAGNVVNSEPLALSEEASNALTITYTNLSQFHNVQRYYRLDLTEFGAIEHEEEGVPYLAPTLDVSTGFVGIQIQKNLAKQTTDIFIFTNGVAIEVQPPYTYSYTNGDDENYTYVDVPAKLVYLPLCYTDNGDLVQNRFDFIDSWDNQYELYVDEDGYWYQTAFKMVIFFISIYFGGFFGAVSTLGGYSGSKVFQIIGLAGSFYNLFTSSVQENLTNEFIKQGFTEQGAKEIAKDMVMNMGFKEMFTTYVSTAGLGNLIELANSVFGVQSLIDSQTMSSEEIQQIQDEQSIRARYEENEDPSTTYVNKIMKIGNIKIF